MSNLINLITEFTPMLDEKFKKESTTSILEGTLGVDFQATQNPKTVKIAKLTTSGMADYSREDGYTDGDITLAWEEHTFTNDRARRFKIDTQDLEESLLQSYAKVVAHVEKYEVAPEIDAYRFAKMASTTGVTSVSGALSSAADTKAAIDTGIAALGENEVDEANMVLFMTPTIRMKLENALPRQLESGVGAYDQRVYYYNGIPIISVPQTRFYSAIDLLDGKTSGEKQGGYKKHVNTGATGDADGKNLNFILLAKDAVSGIVKHEVKNIIEPKYNNTSDGYLVFFRYYHDLFVKENKANGIYVHKAS